MEGSLIEVAKGIGRLFLHPLFYWSFILVLLSGIRRIRQERMDFGTKVYSLFSEWKGNIFYSLLFGFFISVITLSAGFVFTVETLIALSIVMFVLSISFNFAALSPVYSIGITFAVLFLLPQFLRDTSINDERWFTDVNFPGLAILLGLLIIAEALFLKLIKRHHFFPSLVRSERGGWIGQSRIKQFGMIPIFLLIPGGSLLPMEPYWPYVTIGGETYGLLLFPFLLGTQLAVRGNNPRVIVQRMSGWLMGIGVIVTLASISSLFLPAAALWTVIFAIAAKEFILYRYRVDENKKFAYFHPENNGLKVLGVLPGTPAERLGITAGETIVKVNGKPTSEVNEFYEALHDSSASYRLEVLDERGEPRFVQGAFFEGDHHELGLLFTEEPYRLKEKS